MTAVIVNVNKRYKAHAGLRDLRHAVTGEIRVIPLEGIPEIEEGDDLAALLLTRPSGRAGSRTPTCSSSRRRRSRRRRAGSSASTTSSPRERRWSSPTIAIRATSRWILRESEHVVRVRPPLDHRRDEARLRLRVGGRRRVEREGGGDADAAPARSRRVGSPDPRGGSAPARGATSA